MAATCSAPMIRQFDVVSNPVPRRDRPYLLCVQDRQLDHLATRLMAPLATEQVIREASRLHPEFRLQGKRLLLVPYDLIALSVRLFRSPRTWKPSGTRSFLRSIWSSPGCDCASEVRHGNKRTRIQQRVRDDHRPEAAGAGVRDCENQAHRDCGEYAERALI
jgi:hypothetical protein